MIDEIEKLIHAKDFGIKAESVSEIVSAFSDSIVERCKAEFSTLPIIDYQNIDNRAIFMLQLEMKVARDLKTFLQLAILNGKEAEEDLNRKS